MTEHRISPLQWLSTKFASIGHTHNDKEDISNKSSSISTDTGSTSKYPTVKAVEDYSQPKGNYLTSHQNIKTINNETLVGTGNITINTGSSFSGSYADLTNKPSYTATVTSSTTGAYKIGSINISGSDVDIYGKDTDTAPPNASTTVPSADDNTGSYGSGTTYARSNHVHPKSSIYAEAGHNHTGTYANASHSHSYNDINNVTVVEVTVTYTDNSTETIKLLKYTGT